MRLVFRPPWWAWLVTVIAVSLFVNRALWQLDRGEQKQVLLEQRSVALAQAAEVPVGSELRYGSALRLEGQFQPDRQLFHDNQVHDGTPGGHVWSVLTAAHDGRRYLVNRGWLAWNRGAGPPPEWSTPEGKVQIFGQWRPLPTPAMRLGDNRCPAETWPAVVQYPTLEELQCLLGSAPVDGVLLLHPDAPHGFNRNWADAEMPVEKHLGYAFQWAAFAVASIVLFLVLNLRRRPS